MMNRIKWARMRVMWGLMLVFSVVNLGCNKDQDVSILYPYTEYEILHLGNKSGLTSSSSETDFRDGLSEVMQIWSANNPADEEVVFDGVVYEFVDFQEAVGAIPNTIWDVFWEKLDEYSYSVGSCWGFTEVKIPSKGGKGAAYALYAIVTQEDRGNGGEVLYVALKLNVNPKPSSKARSTGINQLNDPKKLSKLIKSAKVGRRVK